MCKQGRNVSTLNEDIQKIIKDLPSVTTSEKIKRCPSDIEPNIWKVLRARDYDDFITVSGDSNRKKQVIIDSTATNQPISGTQNRIEQLIVQTQTQTMQTTS